MEEQTNPTSQKNSAAIWAIAIAIVAVALVAGVCWWQNLKTDELQQKIVDLQNQVTATSGSSEQATSPSEQKLKVFLPPLAQTLNPEDVGSEQDIDKVMLEVINMACLGMLGSDLKGLSQSDQVLANRLFNAYCGRFAY